MATMRDLYEFRHVKEREHALDSMRGYLRNKPEQVKFFEELVGWGALWPILMS
jgi:hypothetical protein